MSKRKTYKEFKQDLAFGGIGDSFLLFGLEIGEVFVKFGLIALPIVIGYVCLPLIALVLFLGITLALPIYVLYKMFKEAFVYGETQYAVLAFAIITLCLGFAEHQNYKNFNSAVMELEDMEVNSYISLVLIQDYEVVAEYVLKRRNGEDFENVLYEQTDNFLEDRVTEYEEGYGDVVQPKAGY